MLNKMFSLNDKIREQKKELDLAKEDALKDEAKKNRKVAKESKKKK